MSTEDIGTLRARLELDDNGFTTRTKAANKSLGGLNASIKNVALGILGANGLQAALTTVAGAVKSSIVNYQQFERRMAEVSTLVDTSLVNMRDLEKGVTSLSRKYGQNAGGLAESLYQTISAGVEAGEAIKFLDEATKLAVGGVTDTKTAVDGLTSVMNAYGMEAKDVSKISDSFFVAVKYGKTTVGELSSVIGQVAPLAKSTGVGLDDMNIALATLTKSGLSTSQAATGLRGILASLIQPTDDAKKAAKALNIEWSVEGVKAAGGFTKFMSQVAEKTGGSSSAITLLIPRVEAATAALTLAGEGSLTAAAGMDLMADKAGAADEATLKMLASGYSGFQRFGKLVESVIRPLAKAATNLFNNMIFGFEYVANKIAGNEDRLEEMRKILYAVNEPIKEITDEEKKQEEQRRKFNEAYKKRLEGIKKQVDDRLKSQGLIGEAEEATEEKAKKSAVERASLEVEAAEAIHNVRVRNYQEMIEHYEAESQKANNTENNKLRATIKAQEKRRDLADLEYLYEQEILDGILEKKAIAAGKDMELLEEIGNWYKAKSEEIKAEWEQRVAKDLEIKAKAQIELDKSTWDKLGDNIHKNFEKWADDLKSGSTTAWSGLVNDTIGIINEIGDMFGGLPPKVSGSIDGIATMINGVLSGNPMTMALGGLKVVGSLIGLSGTEAKKAAEAQRETSRQALEAAKAFLKASGKVDLSLMSKNELKDRQGETGKALQEYVKGTTGLTAYSGDVIAEIGNMNNTDFAKYFKNIVATGNIKLASDVEHIYKAVHGNQTGAALKNEYIDVGNYLSQYSADTDLDYMSASTFQGARQIIEHLMNIGQMTEIEGKQALAERARYFKDSLTPIEYQQYQVGEKEIGGVPGFAAGGIITRPTVAMLGENYLKEAVIPLEDKAGFSRVMKQIASMSSFGGGAQTNPGPVSATITVMIDPNIPLNQDTAGQFARNLANNVTTLLRAKGV